MTFSQNRTLSLSPRKNIGDRARGKIYEKFSALRKKKCPSSSHTCVGDISHIAHKACPIAQYAVFFSLHNFVVFTSWHLTSADLLHFKNPMQDGWREKRRRTHTLTSHTGHSFQSSMHISQTEHIAAAKKRFSYKFIPFRELFFSRISSATKAFFFSLRNQTVYCAMRTYQARVLLLRRLRFALNC